MTRRRLEVADVFREHGAEFLGSNGATLSRQQRKVLRKLLSCRTAALGGHKSRCDECGHEEISYNSCRDRHCPKCQGAARREWLEKQQRYLLDVGYFHITFTVPSELNGVALQNKKVVYGILFRAASETLQTLARDPKHLGAKIGFTAVLHTWGEKLDAHPHLHCIVPAGGISLDGDRWIPCKNDFFVHVKVLGDLFRGKFLAFLKDALNDGKLSFHGNQKHLENPSQWSRFVNRLRGVRWVVDVRRPHGGAKQCLKYLARYTNRIAISNGRLQKLEEGKVTFAYKDYSRDGRQRSLTLNAVEFIRRFLLHVVPSGFQRIRHYGFLANRVREERVRVCRQLLGQHERCDEEDTDVCDADAAGKEPAETVCPICKTGRMVGFMAVERLLCALEDLLDPPITDTS